MPDDIEKINEIFRIHDENAKKKTGQTGKTGAQPAAKPQEQPQEPAAKDKSSRFSAVDNFFIDKNGDENHNYTGDEMTERDYRPVRQSRESRSGCLGGVMYFVFVTALSVVLACFAWMAASDALALNKDNFTAVVTLPNSIFEIATVDDLDENGNKIGTKRVSQADVSYVADALKDAGLIEYKWLFEAFCKISHAGSKVDPGSYELRSSFDYRALIKNMQSGSGSTLTTTVTIPEGFSMHQIFLRLEEEGVCSYNDLMEAASTATFNYAFLEGGEEGSAYRLEGFLFPDTYEFYVGMQASSAINKMLENFYYKQTAEMLQRALRKNPHNVFLANGCGVVLERMGKQQAAMHVFKRVRENALNFTSCCVNVAHLNLLEQRYNDAACLYRAALQEEDGKEDLELYLCLALALARGDNHREAFEVLQQAQKLRPEVAALSVCDG